MLEYAKIADNTRQRSRINKQIQVKKKRFFLQIFSDKSESEKTIHILFL